MAERKSIDERIAELEEKEKKLKAQKKKLKAQQSQAERKARTKRLIEIGAAVEKALGISLDSENKRQALMDILTQERVAKNGSTYSYATYFRNSIESEIEKKFIFVKPNN